MQKSFKIGFGRRVNSKSYYAGVISLLAPKILPIFDPLWLILSLRDEILSFAIGGAFSISTLSE